MRLLHYGIHNENTNKVINVGVNLQKANSKLNELQKANPNNNFKIVYKFTNI